MSMQIIWKLCCKSYRKNNSLQSLFNVSFDYIVFDKGIEVDPKNIGEVKRFPRPHYHSDTHCFLYMVG